MHKEAGRPIPRFSDDDVIDFMVMEAIALKVNHEQAEAQKEEKKREWKKSKSPTLDAMR